jgi:citrate lyase beta subunit
VKIYQFIPLAPVPVMARLIRKAWPTTIPVLDLEDGLQDVCQPANTPERREAARAVLVGLCQRFLQQAGCVQPLALRVNGWGSADLLADLPVAEALAAAFDLQAVLLPKVDEAAGLHRAAQQLQAAGLPAGCIVPVLESKAALLQAPQIAAAAADLGSRAVVFGHYDYCLDLGLWPFPGPDDDAYWQPVATVTAAALKAGLRYIHPPTVNLHDTHWLAAVVTRLASLCGEGFDLFSAGFSQTAGLRELVATRVSDLYASLLPPLAPLPAQQLCALFESCKRPEHAFAVDGKSGRFISPHEYLAAIRHLQAEADA